MFEQLLTPASMPCKYHQLSKAMQDRRFESLPSMTVSVSISFGRLLRCISNPDLVGIKFPVGT